MTDRPLVAQRLARSPEWMRHLLCLASIWATLLGVYFAAGSFRAELAGPDEAAYVVSGIMVREYIAGPLWHGDSPMAFAQQYYDNYPKVAIGHWPPVYFLVQGAWLLLTGVSREAVLALSAFLSACLASLTILLCRREGLRWSMAATAGVVTVLLPVHLRSMLEVGSDVITGIAILVATLCCQRWIAQQNARNSLLFAVSASVAMLCKGSAFLLFLVAPMALLLTQRNWSWLRSRESWRAIAVVALLVLPWYYFARRFLQEEIMPGEQRSVGDAMLNAAYGNAWIFLSLCGLAMLPLALVSVRDWFRRAPAVAVLPIATWLFLTLLSPHTEDRLFLHLVPVFVFSGALAANALLPRVQELVLVAALAIAFGNVRIREKPAVGFVPAVDWLILAPRETANRIFVSSNWKKEGALISEFALRQPTPHRTIVRATKVLQSSTWMGDNVQLRARSAADVAHILDANHITMVVRHVSPEAPPELYAPSLDEVLSHWQLLREFGEVRIYGRNQ